MEKVRIGIIGVGQIGKMHLERYAQIPEAEIVAACDINETELRNVAEKYGIPHTYTDFRELLKRDDLTAVDICLHNNFHAPVTIEVLRSGKHAYCEKPIAGSYADGKQMVETARETGNMLHIQLGQLYTKETKAAKQLIDQGKLGKIFHVRSTGFRRRGRPFVDGYGTAYFTRKETASGGALLDMGVYHISQMLYLLGNPAVQRISGKIYQEMEMDAERRQISGFDVEEIAVGFVRFAGGLTMDVIEAWAVHLGSLEGGAIIGSHGGIRLPASILGKAISDFSYHTTIADMDFDCTVDLNVADTRWHRLRPDESCYDSSQHHWIAALQGRVPLLPTADIALNTMLISEGIYLASRLDREVSVDEVVSMSKSTAVSL